MTPTLPNGFSRDFSEAPEDDLAVGWALDLVNRPSPFSFIRVGNRLSIGAVSMVAVNAPGLLCWCPIPTPGAAVLKELAETKP